MEYHFDKKKFWFLYLIIFGSVYFFILEILGNDFKVLLLKENLIQLLIVIALSLVLFFLEMRLIVDKKGLHSISNFVFFRKILVRKSKTIKWGSIKKVWSVLPFWFPSSIKGVIVSVSFSDSFPIDLIKNYQEILLYMKENTNIPMDENVHIIIERYVKKQSKKKQRENSGK